MAAHSIKTVQKIPISLDEAWAFFSNPANLQAITPSNMGFRVISKHHGEKMYAGQIIEYTVKPVMGIPIYWMTEITQVKDKEYFIDEPGGVEMTDIIHYKNPMWFLGTLANELFVKKQLQGIFDFRFKKVEEMFGKWN